MTTPEFGRSPSALHRCPHRLPPQLRRPAAIALVARALRAAGRKAKLKESSNG
jgi:hypothetical protein